MVKDEWRECPRSSSCQSRPQRTDKSAWPSRESEVTSSTFISYSKLLLQIFQTNMRCHITIWWWWCRNWIRQMFHTSVIRPLFVQFIWKSASFAKLGGLDKISVGWFDQVITLIKLFTSDGSILKEVYNGDLKEGVGVGCYGRLPKKVCNVIFRNDQAFKLDNTS